MSAPWDSAWWDTGGDVRVIARDGDVYVGIFDNEGDDEPLAWVSFDPEQVGRLLAALAAAKEQAEARRSPFPPPVPA